MESAAALKTALIPRLGISSSLGVVVIEIVEVAEVVEVVAAAVEELQPVLFKGGIHTSKLLLTLYRNIK